MVESLHFRKRSSATGRLSITTRGPDGVSLLLRDYSQVPSPDPSEVGDCEAVLERRRLFLQRGIGLPKFEEVQESFERRCRHLYRDHRLNHQHQTPPDYVGDPPELPYG